MDLFIQAILSKLFRAFEALTFLLGFGDVSVPDGYACADCGATNCKLWREGYTFSPKLACCDCAAKDAKEDISDINGDGLRVRDRNKTDMIGIYLMAVPHVESGSYWGYTNIPESDYQWWARLPNRPRSQAAIL